MWLHSEPSPNWAVLGSEKAMSDELWRQAAEGRRDIEPLSEFLDVLKA